MRARSLLIFMLLVGTLTVTPVAAAQTSATDDAYNRDSLGVVGEIQTVEPGDRREVVPSPPESTPEGDLPFTGLELGGVALAGVLLLGSGLLLRRRLAGQA